VVKEGLSVLWEEILHSLVGAGLFPLVLEDPPFSSLPHCLLLE
jgi:hypothetical protein